MTTFSTTVDNFMTLFNETEEQKIERKRLELLAFINETINETPEQKLEKKRLTLEKLSEHILFWIGMASMVYRKLHDSPLQEDEDAIKGAESNVIVYCKGLLEMGGRSRLIETIRSMKNPALGSAEYIQFLNNIRLG